MCLYLGTDINVNAENHDTSKKDVYNTVIDKMESSISCDRIESLSNILSPSTWINKEYYLKINIKEKIKYIPSWKRSSRKYRDTCSSFENIFCGCKDK